MFSVYLTVLEDKSEEEQFIDAYNTYKRLVYHTRRSLYVRAFFQIASCNSF